MARLRLILVCLWPLASSLWAGAFGLGLSAQGGGSLETTFFDGVTHDAIAYWRQPTGDPVARLAAAMAAGTARLAYEEGSGYLRSLLQALDVSIDSQLAVFSKTSLQSESITRQNPRTIFFNDSVAVAWPRGGFIEIAAQSPTQGVAFYMLRQSPASPPQFVRSTACLSCHVSYATLNVPGAIVRSVATAADGTPLPFLANGTSDHRTPFEERWAGWFVTGTIGTLRHLGNTTVAAPNLATAEAKPAATPLAAIGARLDAAGYLSTHSDIAAQLVFDHQMHMMNLITRIGWQTRVALADEVPGTAAAVTGAAGLAAAAVDFVDYLLFVDEARLPAPVKGASGFAERFSALGPRDRRGRSLRELDLQTRVLKYPCSYMIYSPAFDALPAESKRAIYARLADVLSGRVAGERYARLAPADRQAIGEILRDTKSDFAAYLPARP